jgi:hypothetical protein
MRSLTIVVGLVVGLTLVACDRTDPAGAADAAGNGCVEAAKFVYVVDVTNTFSQFDPMTGELKDLGVLACEGQIGAAPYSMSIDRNANAWVVYSDGSLYTVDIQNGLTCTKTAWASPNNLFEFGMGFSSDASGGTSDTLYIASASNATGMGSVAKLARIDTGTLDATVVGTIAGAPELTGTDSAQLWAWNPDPVRPTIEQLDKTTGAVLTNYQSTLADLAGTPMNWAFAFWGGDFWVFLKRSQPQDSTSVIYQIDSGNGAIKSMTPTRDASIVGAGVSTCAPVVLL